jgi:hypothetical protein
MILVKLALQRFTCPSLDSPGPGLMWYIYSFQLSSENTRHVSFTLLMENSILFSIQKGKKWAYKTLSTRSKCVLFGETPGLDSNGQY